MHNFLARNGVGVPILVEHGVGYGTVG